MRSTLFRRTPPDRRGTYRVTVRTAHGDVPEFASGYQLVVDAPSRRTAGEAAAYAAEVAHGGMFEAVAVRRAGTRVPADLTV